MGQKNKTGVVFLVLAILLAVGGYTAFKSMNEKQDIGQITQDRMEQVNIDSDNLVKDEAETVGQKVNAAVAQAAQENAEPPSTPAMQEGELVVEEGNPVVAKVDGKPITRVDVYRFIQTMPANIQQMPATSVYPMAMEQVINTRIVQNKTEATKIEDTPEFKREMEMARQQIARNLYLQQQVDAKISESRVKKAYEEYLKQIPNVEERRARHILLETEEKANAAIAKLKTDSDFEALAKSISVGPSAANGGDLGYFAKQDMVPEFSEAAFKMKKGDIIEAPVKTQFGWHVIQLVDVRQRPKPTMEQIEPMIRAEIRREVLEELIGNWRKDVKIEQFDINGRPLKKGADATGLVPPAE